MILKILIIKKGELYNLMNEGKNNNNKNNLHTQLVVRGKQSQVDRELALTIWVIRWAIDKIFTCNIDNVFYSS